MALHDLAVHPLAVTSMSVSKDGRKALSASLDGTVVLVHPSEGKVLGRLESGREGMCIPSFHPAGLIAHEGRREV